MYKFVALFAVSSNLAISAFAADNYTTDPDYKN